MAVTNGWGQAAKNNTNGFGKLATNNIGAGSIYENSYSGDTALIGTSAAFSYSKSSFNQGEADPTPTITGTTGGTFNADAGVVFVDTGSFNSSTGQIDLSATTIDNHIITYTVDGVQSGQSVGVTAAPYSSTSSFLFDGVDENFLSSLNMTNSDITLSYWMNGTGTYAANNYYAPVGIKPSSGAVNQSLGTLYKRPNLHAALQGFDSTNTSYSTWTARGVNLEATGWNHILWTFNNTTKHTYCYIDGVSQTFTNFGGSATTSFLTSRNVTFSTPLSIGSFSTGTNVLSPFDGLVDEVSVWDSVLSSDAITEIYNSGAPSELTSLTNASSSNLKAWYKMGE